MQARQREMNEEEWRQRQRKRAMDEMNSILNRIEVIEALQSAYELLVSLGERVDKLEKCMESLSKKQQPNS